MRRIVLLALAAVLGLMAPAYASYGPEKLANPKLEARAVALQRNLRCLVCQGESLDESNAQLADDLRRLIRARIASGESDRQIVRFLVSRYGDVILMKPPLKAETYALWFGPVVILVLGGAFAASIIYRAQPRNRG